MNHSPIDRYTPAAIAFHWLLAFAIMGSFGMGLYLGLPTRNADRVSDVVPSGGTSGIRLHPFD